MHQDLQQRPCSSSSGNSMYNMRNISNRGSTNSAYSSRSYAAANAAQYQL